MPHLRELKSRYNAQGFEIVGVCLGMDADRERFESLVRKHPMPWPMVYTGGKDPKAGLYGELHDRFCVSAVPVHLLLDQRGYLVDINPDKKNLEATLQRLLNSKGEH